MTNSDRNKGIEELRGMKDNPVNVGTDIDFNIFWDDLVHEISDSGASKVVDFFESLQQSLSERDRRVKELEEIIKEFLHLHNCEMEGIPSGQPTYAQWMSIINIAEQSLANNNEDKG